VRRFSGKVAFSCQILTTVACGLAVSSTGCNECTPGPATCDGNVRRWCEYDNQDPFTSATWHQETCGVACRQLAGEGTCVAAAAPVAECMDEAPASSLTCFAGEPVSCEDGYPIMYTTCDPGMHCAVSALCGPVCAVEDAPEARCAAGRRVFCDDDGTLVTCACEYVWRRDDCGSTLRCHEVGDEAACASPDLDPRCGDPTLDSSGFCDGNTAYTCWHGYSGSGLVCGDYQCVIVSPKLGAGCSVPVSTN